MAHVTRRVKSSLLSWVILVLLVITEAILVTTVAHHVGHTSRHNDYSVTSKVKPILPTVTTAVKAGVPLRLTIPGINLDTAIDQVSLTPSGDLGVPSTIASTGWYKDGVRPGEAGSAVIDGHYGWINGQPAVFNNLNKLQKGDKLYVTDTAGVSLTFTVRGSKMYIPGENAAAVFHSDDGKAYLNLITCQGTWENSQHSYSNRLVVFTEKEIPPSHT